MKGYFHFLREVPFFQNLNDEDIRDIMRYCREVELTPGKVIFYEGEAADRFYIVMEGEVEVWKDYDSPYADLLAVHGINKLFGEMALVDNLPRSATVVTRTRSRLLYINEEEFQRLLKENSLVALAIIRSLSAMVRKSNQSFVEDLRERNRQLQKAYDELQAAQDELLRNERLTTLGKFSSMILHDIRNPISVIKAYADMLSLSSGKATSGEASKETKYLDKISFETERLNQLANELLDYSRGEIRLDMGIVSIPDFFREICDFTDHRFTSKDIKVECSYDYDGQVIMDHKRMLRVFTNLLENARKALGRQGSCKVSAVQENQMIKFSVRDDGSGMSQEVLDHIFEPFYSSSPNGGTGLGMAIVKSVVEAHHGTVEIESSEGQGTEVLIRIPLRL
ncbi:MAG: cyclic nucleotide-binding domain-containing protein [Spirochaetaceae bacterium]|nr:cyclic nucleotide-binding domain-containing protein [Spirochaetaceae bacterium]MCF7948560.1 cyclic nucleotide-binding domain-containing protein [Spirochaetia bacterium]MCF7951239.1 cyclic nucleotide-binding domain-containing protein [Spirochaetaceae bacterium]